MHLWCAPCALLPWLHPPGLPQDEERALARLLGAALPYVAANNAFVRSAAQRLALQLAGPAASSFADFRAGLRGVVQLDDGELLPGVCWLLATSKDAQKLRGPRQAPLYARRDPQACAAAGPALLLQHECGTLPWTLSPAQWKRLSARGLFLIRAFAAG